MLDRYYIIVTVAHVRFIIIIIVCLQWLLVTLITKLCAWLGEVDMILLQISQNDSLYVWSHWNFDMCDQFEVYLFPPLWLCIKCTVCEFSGKKWIFNANSYVFDDKKKKKNVSIGERFDLLGTIIFRKPWVQYVRLSSAVTQILCICIYYYYYYTLSQNTANTHSEV